MSGTRPARRGGAPQVPARPANVTLRNLTARRIGIAALDARNVELIVPPFGERTLDAAELEAHDYEKWTDQRLVSVTPEEQPPGRSRAGSARAAAAAGPPGGSREGVWTRILRSWTILVVTVIAVGLPVAALGTSDRPSYEPGGAVLFVVLVAIAAGTPGGLYFLFQRQKLPTLRDTFIRDLVRLDPNVQTTRDAENAYGSLIEEAYGSGWGGLASGAVPIFLATLLLASFWVWVLGDSALVAREGAALATFPVPRKEVAAFAFLGSYVFAVNMVFRRYARADLGPKAYTHIVVRTLAAVVSAWAVSYLPGLQLHGEPRPILLVLAFFIGVVPETGTAVVQDFLKKQKILGSIPSVAERHPLSKLNGISLYDATHLLEAGIENVEGLAHHRLVDLMLWTRIPTSRLVDLVDQAILYLHVRGPVDLARHTPGPRGDADADELEDDARMLLCRYGIRTATDLERAVRRAAGRRSEDQVLRLLGGTPGVRRLRVVLDAMEDDEWLAYVRNWREINSAGGVVGSVEEFIKLANRSSRLPTSREPAGHHPSVGAATAEPGDPTMNGDATRSTRRISVARAGT